MFDNIKTIMRVKKLALGAGKGETDENGKSVLRLTVRDDDNFLSPYSHGGQSVISSEVADFLDNSAQSLDLKRGIHIIIRGNTIDEEERGQYPAAIKKYYGNRIIETDGRLRKNLFSAVVMAVIAAVVLFVCIELHLSDAHAVAAELVDIAAWVFAWEAVDLTFLARPLLRREQLLSCRLYEAEVTYE